MTRLKVNRIKVAIVSTLLVVGIMANPARADHNNFSIAPLATFVFLDLLLRNRHEHRFSFSRNSHGHHHRHNRRGHSHSQEGFSHRSGRIYTKRRFKH